MHYNPLMIRYVPLFYCPVQNRVDTSPQFVASSKERLHVATTIPVSVLCFGFVSVLYFGLRDICGYLCLCFVSDLCLCFISDYVDVKENTKPPFIVKGTLTHPQATVVHPKGSHEPTC